MRIPSLFYKWIISLSLILICSAQKQIPTALEDWQDWATWNQQEREVPFLYNNPATKVQSWNTGLDLSVNDGNGRFSYSVEVFQPSWITLPGDRAAWPIEVAVNSERVPVMSSKNQLPQIFLEKGAWQISGVFQWDKMPQVMTLPKSVGILNLTRSGVTVSLPTWDNFGKLWLKRSNNETTAQNYLSAQVYRHLQDGAPLWLNTDVELTVTGKSREEELGHILPEGWKIASVRAPIPCAIDDKGLLKTQVRAGKWVISIRAFRTTPPMSVRYIEGARPIVQEEFISLENRPNFRLIEFRDVVAVDAAQTTFPDKWKSFPLHLWNNEKPFRVEEKLRGMGEKKAPGIAIERRFWLDEDGKMFTYKDLISGSGLQTWRLDAADGQALGAAKIGGQSQLITKNPINGATGVEVRVRNLDLQSVGRMNNKSSVAATGWKQNADSLKGELFLPPGWRAFAILGPDDTRGDWVSNWSLLDVFLLLIFTVSLWKIAGWKTSVLGCVTFLLCFHESGAPKVVWAILLLLIALLKALPANKFRNIIRIATYVILVILAVILVPFMTKQIQQAIYPQLESHSLVGTRNWNREVESIISYKAPPVSLSRSNSDAFMAEEVGKFKYSKKNLKYDSKAKIQTGPAIPEWSWRSVSFSWSGPVSESETISFILIPRWLQTVITFLRVITMLTLFYSLLRLLRAPEGWGISLPKVQGASVAVLLLTILFLPQAARAQAYPSPELIETLGKRLEQPLKNLEKYAEIPQVDLSLNGRELRMEVEVHAAETTAVPLPGLLPTWSPLSVANLNGDTPPLVRRDGYLWVMLSEGTHNLIVEGMIPSSEWTWTFLLKPQYVNVASPGWAVTGMKPSGIPEAQVFFSEQNRSEDEEAAYDRKDFMPIFQVNRSLELGLIWESSTTIERLSNSGKAVTINLPLLEGERILTPGFEAKDGRIEIRLGANQNSVSWQSEIEQNPEIKLKAEKNDQWVEKWSVITSSIWNISIEGLAPVYERNDSEMIPMWHPWSNGDDSEQVILKLARPEAIEGDTLTIRQAIHKMNFGSRQRSSSLELSLQTSLGRDFQMGLSPSVSITSLSLNGVETPIRKDGNNIVIPLRPGEQSIKLKWKTPSGIEFQSLGDEVTLPVECSNTSTVIEYSESNRLTLWASGPLRGPAIRMWPLLMITILAGVVLGRIKQSPLKTYEWVLLFLGLAQIPVFMSALIVFWLFWVSFKRANIINHLPNSVYNIYQLSIVLGVIPFIVILLFALYQGLLGTPEMRIMGESSRAGYLKWFQARGENLMLPQPIVYTVSIWFFRAFMLLWSVWLAFALLKWVKWAWSSLGEGGYWKKTAKPVEPPKAKPEE